MKLITFHGGVETLEFFSQQMAEAFVNLGYEIFIFDLTRPGRSIKNLKKFLKAERAAALTFNHTGIAGEEYIYSPGFTSNIWDELDITFFNIVVDHPFYYHKYLKRELIPKKYHQISIDMDHMTYMKRYFPWVDSHIFLPLAGTGLAADKSELKPFDKRENEIVFTGNYRAPEIFLKYIEGKGKEYVDFYMGILDDLKADPDATLEEKAYLHVKNELGEISDDDMRGIYENMIFLDLMIRFYYRGEVIKAIADGGHRIRIYGAGWEELKCRHPENLESFGFLTSKECLELIADSRLSINVMPWFKRGAHDRIFNTMLNGAVSVTDRSLYLDTFLKDRENALYFDLKDLSNLPGRIEELIKDRALAEEIAMRGYDFACRDHTWEKRAQTLHSFLQN